MAKLILKVVLICILAFGTLVSVGTYMFLKTPAPLKIVQHIVNDPVQNPGNNLQWGSVEGSLSEGFVFNRFSLKSHQNEATFDRLALTYRSDTLSSGLDALIITEVAVENGKIKISDLKSLKRSSKDSTETPGTPGTPPAPTTRRRQKDVNITVEKVLLKNVELVTTDAMGAEKSIKLDKLSIRDISLTSLNEQLSFLVKNFDFEIKNLTAKGGSLEASYKQDKSSLTMKEPLQIQIKKEILPSVLISDVDIKVSLSHTTEKSSTQIELLDGEITHSLDKDKKEWVLNCKNLQLSKYFSTSPIEVLSFYHSYPEEHGVSGLVKAIMQESPKNITLKIGQHEFTQAGYSQSDPTAGVPAQQTSVPTGTSQVSPIATSSPNDFAELESKDLLKLKAPKTLPPILFSLMMPIPTPLFKAVQSYKSDKQDTLAFIYHQKSAKDLADTDKELIEKKGPYFDFSQTIFAVVVPKAPKRLAQKKMQNRKPASVKKLKKR